MADTNLRRWLLRGFWINSLGTLASRVLGLVRDMATAALLGLGEGGVMDAFVVAFRLPNLPRRILGEGALAASLLPVFTAEFEQDRRRAWRLLSVLFTWLSIVLVLVVIVCEACCALLARSAEPGSDTQQLVALTATMLPYMLFICLAAQAAAALQALGSFAWPAIAPVLMNVCWLAAVWGVAPYFAPDKLAQAQVIAAAIVISGVLQLAVQLPALAKLGFRFEYDWPASRAAFWRVIRSMLPIMLGIAVTQLNTLMDSLIAWGLAADEPGETIAWLGDRVAYPMQRGAAAAIYYGERFYQLPVGMLGVAIATVAYPLFSLRAARGLRAQLGSDLTLALRVVWAVALPASVGIMLIAQPLARVLFERGAFTAADAQRAAATIACYASGVWAYCALGVLVRAFYSADDSLTPARLGLAAVALNLTLNLTLVWPLAERGLAISTAIAAAAQVISLVVTFSRRIAPLNFSELMTSVLKGGIAAAAMTCAVLAIDWLMPEVGGNRTWRALEVGAMVIGGGATYLAAAAWLGMHELALIVPPVWRRLRQ